MSNINLEEGKINFEGKWFSADELASIIKKKMDEGDLKFATMAAALEKLKKAIEDAYIIDETIVVEKHVYEKLKEIGDGDEKEGLRKAVMAYIYGDKKQTPKETKSKQEEVTHLVEIKDASTSSKEGTPRSGSNSNSSKSVKCTNCKSMIPVSSDERPIVVVCPGCNTSCRVTL